MDKHTLRKVYLEKRIFLSDQEYQKRNELICERLKSLIQKHNFKNIHLFFSIRKFREIDLSALVHWAHQRHELSLITSVSNTQKAKMTHYLVTEETEFQLNKWGIPEPKDAALYDLDQIDCVIVPMVTGNKSGHRIGYGKGYYDQFLKQCPDNTCFIGVNIAPLLEGHIFSEEHDIAMNYMLTPFETIKIN